MDTSFRLLLLPYDVRYLIYQHLFPPGKHIYIQAGSDSLVAINERTARTVPTGLLRACRSLNDEVGQFLYTNYLFHIVGQKEDCLANYGHLERMLHKYGKATVHVHPLSNGIHSQTGAILLHVGDARLAMIKARGRGVSMSIEEMRQELRKVDGTGERVRGLWRGRLWEVPFRYENWATTIVAIMIGFTVALLAVFPIIDICVQFHHGQRVRI